MSDVRTPRPWPENAMPTPQQLADWMVACTPEERLTLAEKMLHDVERASRCFVMNHTREIEHLQHQLTDSRRDT